MAWDATLAELKTLYTDAVAQIIASCLHVKRLACEESRNCKASRVDHDNDNDNQERARVWTCEYNLAGSRIQFRRRMATMLRVRHVHELRRRYPRGANSRDWQDFDLKPSREKVTLEFEQGSGITFELDRVRCIDHRDRFAVSQFDHLRYYKPLLDARFVGLARSVDDDRDCVVLLEYNREHALPPEIKLDCWLEELEPSTTPVIVVADVDLLARKIPTGQHQGRPPLSWEGAPTLQSRCCAYCKRKFESSKILLRHLESHWGKRTNSDLLWHRAFAGQETHVDLSRWAYCTVLKYHQLHTLRISPERVLAEGITRCPVPECDDGGDFASPGDLLAHFAALGIAPFWPDHLRLPQLAPGLLCQ